MHPILLKIGHFSIYSYGAMLALGFGIATFLIYKRAPSFNLDKNKIIDLAILVLAAGIVGARLLYLLLNLEYYISRPIEMLDLSKGGLVWYGGFFAGFLALIFYAWWNKLQFWATADLAAPYIALAQSLGRVGCFLNGCCFGIIAPITHKMGIIFPEDYVPRHPTQIYSSIALILIFIILRIGQEEKHFGGEIFLGYCILYSSKRFLIEFLRGDNAKILWNLTLFQYISILMLSLSLAVFIYKAVRWRGSVLSSR